MKNIQKRDLKHDLKKKKVVFAFIYVLTTDDIKYV
jgi:hypothetical protein